MHRLKNSVRSWDWRRLIFMAAGAATFTTTLALAYFLTESTSEQIAIICAGSSLGLLLTMRLRPLAKRALPVPRERRSINMTLA